MCIDRVCLNVFQTNKFQTNKYSSQEFHIMGDQSEGEYLENNQVQWVGGRRQLFSFLCEIAHTIVKYRVLRIQEMSSERVVVMVITGVAMVFQLLERRLVLHDYLHCTIRKPVSIFHMRRADQLGLLNRQGCFQMSCSFQTLTCEFVWRHILELAHIFLYCVMLHKFSYLGIEI